MTQTLETKPTLLPTPMEKLAADKERVKAECALRKEKIDENFRYMRDYSGRLILSGLSSAVLPSPKQSGAKAEGLGLFSLVWNITRPLLFSWGIKRVQRVIGRATASNV